MKFRLTRSNKKAEPKLRSVLWEMNVDYFLNLLSMALENPRLVGVERPQTLFYFSLKQTDSPIAIKARLVHAREKASGGTGMILRPIRVPMAAKRKLTAARPISAFLIYSIAYLLLCWDLVWDEIL